MKLDESGNGILFVQKLIKPMEYIRIEDYNVIIYEINIFNYLDIFIDNIK